MKRKNSILIIAFALFSLKPAFAKLKVITTSKDNASIAKEIAGDLADVKSLIVGNQDIHFARAQPNYILQASKADLFIQIGLELEIGWAPLVINQSRNIKIQPGGRGFCDTSRNIKPLQRVTGEINRQMGDLHALGNPHYWVDPINGIKMARTITNCFIRVDAANAATYKANLRKFTQKTKKLAIRLMRKMKRHRGKKVITYHAEFIYLLQRLKIKVVNRVEKYPGALPGPTRKSELVSYIQQNKIKTIIVSPWTNIGIAREVAEKSGAKIVILPIQTGSSKNTETYHKMLERCVEILDAKL